MIRFLAAALLGLALALPAAAQESAAAASARAPRVLGKSDAPVLVVEYASLTCEHCARFHAEILPQVKRELIDTGKIRLEFRDFPLERRAFEGAVLARCVPPAQYFPTIALLLEKQRIWARQDDPVPALARIGVLAGLPEAAYQACRADKGVGEAVVASRLEGERLHGVKGTPSFLIGGKMHQGIRSYEEFRQLVEPLLAKAAR